jgi:hypothetical protein
MSYITYVISLVLLAASAAWMFRHTRSWREVQQQTLPAEEFEFRYRQFRRRMQTSAMLGILGVVLSAGDLVQSARSNPWIMAIYCMIILTITFWMILLAISDIWATRFHYGRIRQRFLNEQAKLEAEFRRHQREKNDDIADDEDDEVGG